MVVRRSRRLPRALYVALLSLGTFTVTFLFGLDHFFPFLPAYFMGSLPTDEESLALYTPEDEVAREIDEHIENHPMVQKLRAESRFSASRPHLKIPIEIRGHNLTAGTLTGPGKIVVPPLNFNDTTSHELVSVFYLGSDVSGHPGIVHGGLLATLLDEGLARCCFPALPNKVAMTAMLNIEYKKPAMAGNFFVLRAKTTKIEGRKAWVEGHIELLVGEGEEAEALVGAKALFIEPRSAKVSFLCLPIHSTQFLLFCLHLSSFDDWIKRVGHLGPCFAEA